MGRSKQLRLADMRAIFRLIGECRELGVDSTLWRRHLLTQMLRLTGGRIAMGGPASIRDGYLQPDPVPSVDLGWDGPRERGAFVQYLRDEMHTKDPALKGLCPLLEQLRRPMDSLTRCRRQLADDSSWYGSAAFCDYHRPSGADDGLMSVVALSNGEVHGIALFRSPNERPFTARHRRLLHVLHTELAPHLMSDLAPPGCDPISSLSPRLRSVLLCLLEGDTERQAALRLGLSRDTTHQYVKTIYRQLEVSSRGELMARFVRFPTHIAQRRIADGSPPENRL